MLDWGNWDINGTWYRHGLHPSDSLWGFFRLWIIRLVILMNMLAQVKIFQKRVCSIHLLVLVLLHEIELHYYIFQTFIGSGFGMLNPGPIEHSFLCPWINSWDYHIFVWYQATDINQLSLTIHKSLLRTMSKRPSEAHQWYQYWLRGPIDDGSDSKWMSTRRMCVNGRESYVSHHIGRRDSNPGERSISPNIHDNRLAIFKVCWAGY